MWKNKILANLTRASTTAFWLIIAIHLLALPAQAYEVAAALDRNPIGEQESVVLRLSVQEQVQDEPDLTPLQQDFDLAGTQRGTQMSMINGVSQTSTTWQVTLYPKRAGDLVIPPITVGQSASKALVLTVRPAAQTQAGGQPERLFFRAEIEPTHGLVQAQMTLRLRLYTRVNISRYQWPEVKIPEASLHPLGEPRQFDTTLDGQRYAVLEQAYALFPERSGTLEIPAFTLAVDAQLDPQARSRSLLDDFFSSRGQVVRLRSQAAQFEIRAIPAEFNGPWWLPAEQVTLTESWPQDPPQFKVDEPITRTVELRAVGVTDAQLPALPVSEVEGIKVYPDQPQAETRWVAPQLLASRQQKLALAPSRAGKFTLPEIRVPWWNTRTGKMEEAVLPAREIVVAANPQAAPAPVAAQPAPVATIPLPRPSSGPSVPSIDPNAPPQWWLWSHVALVVLWLATLAGWLYTWRARRQQPVAPLSAEESPSHQAARAALRQACQSNHAQAAARALLDWQRAAATTPAEINLPAIAARLDEPAARAVRELEQYLLGAPEKNPSTWDGNACWQALDRALRTAPSASTGVARPTPALPRLYPQTLST